MKIGQLAKLCGVSVATVRYYVSMGMLIPNDSSAQYDFSEREVEDLNLILKMRKHQFKLKEIQQYLRSACVSAYDGRTYGILWIYSQNSTHEDQSVL